MNCLPSYSGGAVAAFLFLILVPELTAIPQNVWINEIHYDNGGSDIGEFIEISGIAGTELDGHSLSLYNGSTGLNYGNITLSGVLPDQLNGFGTLSFAKTGIQNGAPDGLALIDPLSSVIQFLSYEGIFTALNGPAVGLLSTDIGVSEASSTAIGSSLQLIGFGSEYSDFSWSGPLPESAGNINSGQTYSTPIDNVPDSGSSALILMLGISALFIAKRNKRNSPN